MTDRSGNEFVKMPCMFDMAAPFTYQSITDMECQMAAFACREFELGNYELCMKTLKYLQANRPQDIKVIHNICVADFYTTKCLKAVEFYCNMNAVCCQISNLDVADIDCIENDVDQCVMFYNKAVIMYHLHKLNGAILILDRVFQLVEPLDESLGRKVCLTLLELYVAAYEPKRALALAAYLESVLCTVRESKSSKHDKEHNKELRNAEELKLRLAQCKSRCYAMMKTVKPCKREIKILMVSGIKAKQIGAFILRSQLEYQKGNYKKAVKILNSTEWPDFSEFFCATGDCLQALYNNNLGCIMFSMGKPSLGVFYIQQGLKQLYEELKKMKFGESGGVSSQPVHTLSLGVHHAMKYNLAMQYFRKQDYKTAFISLLEVSKYYKNARIWLRIADCCIQERKKNWKNNISKYDHTQIIKSVIGNGIHRKVILDCPSIDPQARNDSKAISPSLTLDYAMVALQNALVILNRSCDTHTVPNTLSKSESNIAHTLEAKNDQNPSEICFAVVPPCNALSEAELEGLRNAILLASSYVSLKLGDLIMAHEYAVEVLAQPKVSEYHKFLAHMYAGEALVAMDKISEAVEHIYIFSSQLAAAGTPLKFPDDIIKCSDEYGIQSSESDSDVPVQNDGLPQSLMSAKLIAEYNLSLLYAMRGEWSKAMRLVRELIADEDAPVQAKALMVYIQLSRGATAFALSQMQERKQFFEDELFFDG